MTGKALVGAGLASGLLLAATAAHAEGLPVCRVRVVGSAATEAVPRSVFGKVEGWVDVPGRGCRVVSSIDEADVLLELNRHEPTTTRDGTPAEEWRFVARRLSEPVRERATVRYAVTTLLDRRTEAYVARHLPTLVVDVCLGHLPKVPADRPDLW